MAVTPFSLGAAIRELAGERGDEVAFVTAQRTLRFSELDERSTQVAAALAGMGVAPGDRVALLAHNDAEFLETMIGVSKSGGALVALNWRLSAPEIGAILADARPTVIVCEAELVGLLGGAASERPAGTPVVLGGEPYEAWLSGASGGAPARLAAADPSSDAIALVLYSSGTTGLPKGVMLTNENLSYIPVMARELFRMSADSVHLLVAPLFHIGGAATGLTTTTLGGRTVVLREADPDSIERERVTHAFFVPAVIQRLGRRCGRDRGTSPACATSPTGRRR